MGNEFENALRNLEKIKDSGTVGLYKEEIANKYYEILRDNGYIIEITKDWYLITNSQIRENDLASWLSDYWGFCGKFLDYEYNYQWCLSVEQSLLIHAGNWSVPKQPVISSPLKDNYVEFIHNTSLLNLQADLPSIQQIVIERGLRIHSLQSSLIYSSPNIFKCNPNNARSALLLINDSSELLPILIKNNLSENAGRICGALRNIKRTKIANEIMETMYLAGFDIEEKDPF